MKTWGREARFKEISLAPVVQKPISPNPRLNRPNPRSKFILRLNSVPQSSISTIQGLNQDLRESPAEDHAGKSTVHITDSPETWHTCTTLLAH